MTATIAAHPIFSAITIILVIVGLALMQSRYRVYWLYVLIPATVAELAYERTRSSGRDIRL